MMFACQGASGAEPSRSPTAVFAASTCPVSGESPEQPLATESIGAVVLAALIPSLVNKTVDAIGNYLQSKADDTERRQEASVGLDFYAVDDEVGLRANPQLGCIVFIQGGFKATKADRRDLSLPSIPEAKFNQLKDTFGLVTQPDLYSEFVLQVSHDKTAFRLAPSYLLYRKALSNKGGIQGIAFLVQFKKPTEAAGGAVFAATSLPFKDLQPPVELDKTFFARYEASRTASTWMPPLALPAGAETRIASLRTAVEGIARHDAALAEVDPAKIRQPDAGRKLCQSGKTDEDLLKALSARLKKAQQDAAPYQMELGIAAMEVEARRAGFTKDPTAANRQALRAAETSKARSAEALKPYSEDLEYYSVCIGWRTLVAQRDNLVRALKHFGPVDVSVTAIETRDPGSFIKFAAAVFSGSKETLSANLAAELDENKQEAEAETKKKERQTAELAAYKEQTEAEAARVAYESETDPAKKATAELNLRLAKREANVAFFNLGWPIPYPEIWP
jgi:hypothetical protein